MLRVKDPQISLDFYKKNLKMHKSLLLKMDFEDMKFSLYFLGFERPEHLESMSFEQKKQFVFNSTGILELTHNWGTENQAEFEYHNGNSEPRGFGHIGITVENIEHVCQELEANQVPFKKRLHEGKMKNIAFVLDPDGYWIELVASNF